MVPSKATLWESGHDETVEVNQRALIDKVLARYSGEFTVFRELLQNSDDAQSQAVEIRFETRSFLDRASGESLALSVPASNEPLPDLKTTVVQQWIFKNNGIIFRDEDWSRLKKIAEGNPDEEKIGAFGVGFYSLFSVTEEPFVSSGDQWMGFYWKDRKDQLFARRGQLPPSNPEDHTRLWTTFTMALRDPSPIPSAFDITRFLASSITFMKHLREITVYFDDKRLVKLNKASGLPQNIPIPKGYNNRSPEKTMTVIGVESTPVYIQAEVMKWLYTSSTKRKTEPTSRQSQTAGFFSSLYSSLAKGSNGRTLPAPTPETENTMDPFEITQTGVSLSIFSATVQVNLDKKMTAELVRSTKKNPPSKMKFELIYTSKDEYDTSLKEDSQLGIGMGSIFQGLRADLHKAGHAKVFIGHSTSQTTGIGGHIAARFIPTVEREAIDFMDRHVAIWNKELSYAGGLLARIAYDNEIRNMQRQWEAAPPLPSAELKSRLISQVLHTLQFFDFYESQPSKEVSAHLREAFFACSANENFQMISTTGVRISKSIRLPDPLLGAFMKNIPMLPDEILTANPVIIEYLRYTGVMRNIQFPDIIQELHARPLTLDECSACLTWWVTESRRDSPTNRDNYISLRTQLLNAIVIAIQIKEGGDEKFIPLNSIKYFYNSRSPTAGSLPLDGPLPDSLLPISVSKMFKLEEILGCFPWVEFHLRHWLLHISDTDSGLIPVEYNICLSPSWSEKVIGVIARGWGQLSEDTKASIKDILRDKACIPTTNGLKKPSETYFPTVHIFPDLPVVKFPSNLPIRSNVEKLLLYLDVRKHVDLQLIFNRMVKTNEWTVTDLTKYLVSIRDLNEEEIQRLRNTPAFPKEMTPNVKDTTRQRFMAHQLYPPVEVFRTLGLPILEWGEHVKWRDKSDEAKFLYNIGLKRHPSLQTLIELCASGDEKIRSMAFQYLIDHLETEYHHFNPSEDQRFIPSFKGSEPCLASVKEVYSHSAWATMGFLVLQPRYQPYATKLKIREHPTAAQFITLLQTKPPSNTSDAIKWFSLLASRVNDFRNSDLEQLSTMLFVPIAGENDKDGGTVRWLPPTQCYLRGETNESFHSKLFTFVDFGASGNAFLAACGTKNQPSVEEVAKILLDDPRHFYGLSGGPTNFLAELRNLAVNSKNLSNGTILRMKRSSILLGIKRKSRSQEKSDDDWDEDIWEVVYDLKRPSEIVIADDTNAYQAFGDSLFAAPQEDVLEAFYMSLGSHRLSRLVREDYNTSSEIVNSKIGQETRSLILERLPLFLYEHTHTATKVSFSWFSAANNFAVKTFGKLMVVKHLNFGDVRVTKKQDASAISLRHGSGPIELWVAGNAQIDMYEVATSLNRLLFVSPKANDALLFMTFLSTDLRSLKRRGYNVERILRQQKEARLAEAARLKKEQEKKQQAVMPHLPSDMEKASSLSSNTLTPTQAFVPPATSGVSAFARHLQNLKRRTGLGSNDQSFAKLENKPVTDASPTPPPLPMLDKKPLPVAPKIGNKPASDSQGSPSPPMLDTNPTHLPLPQVVPTTGNKPVSDLRARSPSPPPSITKPLPCKPLLNSDYSLNEQYLSSVKTSDEEYLPGSFPPIANDVRREVNSRPTPLSDISRNIDVAIGACKSESGDVLQNRERMERVKESLNDGYCDISGRKDNFHHIAQMDTVKIYLSDEFPLTEAATWMQTKRDTIARFIYVIKPLADIFRLSLSHIHIFCDREGGLIAMNRNGGIFLNLRYFEQWHDANVSRGDLKSAYISWYFSIAHEIAHNLVHPHNSEHEFYFSAICEQFMLALTKLLAMPIS